MDKKHCLPVCQKQPPPRRPTHHVPPKVQAVLNSVKDLDVEEQFSLIFQLVRSTPCSPPQMKILMNVIRDQGNALKKPPVAEADKEVISHEVGGVACEQPGRVVSGAPSTSKPNASKTSLIFRGDVLESQDILFLDVEKVKESKSHQPVAGDLAVVDKRGRVLIWCYIQRDDVCTYNTHFTGLSRDNMQSGLNIQEVQKLLMKALKGKEVWGADIQNDFRSLNFDPKNLPFDVKLKDIQSFFRDFKGDRISLSLLSKHFVGEDIHEGCHSSVTDARVTAICYKKMQRLISEGFQRFSCPEMDEVRADAQAKEPATKWDRCTCGTFKSKGKKRRFPLNNFNTIPDNEWDLY